MATGGEDPQAQARAAQEWRGALLARWVPPARQAASFRQRLHGACLRGIPPAVRAQAWAALLGNELRINRELFDVLRARAEEVRFVTEREDGGYDTLTDGGGDDDDDDDNDDGDDDDGDGDVKNRGNSGDGDVVNDDGEDTDIESEGGIAVAPRGETAHPVGRKATSTTTRSHASTATDLGEEDEEEEDDPDEDENNESNNSLRQNQDSHAAPSAKLRASLQDHDTKANDQAADDQAASGADTTPLTLHSTADSETDSGANSGVDIGANSGASEDSALGTGRLESSRLINGEAAESLEATLHSDLASPRSASEASPVGTDASTLEGSASPTETEVSSVGAPASSRDRGLENGEKEGAVSCVASPPGRVRMVTRRTTLSTQIELDLSRTFPTLAFFQEEDGPFRISLQEILEAFSQFRPGLGYVQGMSHVAAMLLLYMERDAAFICFCNLLQDHQFYQVLRSTDASLVSRYMNFFDELLAEHIPQLHEHFSNLGLRPDMYIVNWLLTLFTQCLELDAAARVWDCYLFCDTRERKERFLWRACLALLKTLDVQLRLLDFDAAVSVLRHAPPVFSIDKFFFYLGLTTLTSRQYHSLRKRVGLHGEQLTASSTQLAAAS